MIPILDLTRQYRDLKQEIDAAMQRVAAGGRYILGPEVQALERELAAYCGCAHGVGVANGTDALHLALRALRIGPGDEVITTPFTFVATTEAIGMVGATPVFVDIDPGTFNLDARRLEAAITPRTRAIMPVHLYGQPCDMDPILDLAAARGLKVIEDCAQALGAKHRDRMVGALGDVGCLSFFPSKNLGCFGDGGMVVTNDAGIAERVEMLRRHGGRVKYRHSELGLNSRLDELQAAILRVKLPHLEEWIESRRAIAARYDAQLRDLPGLVAPAAAPAARHVYHQYTLRLRGSADGGALRDRVRARLEELGVQTMVYYPIPLHLQEVHAALGHSPGAFPRSEAAAASCFSLPMFPELTAAQQGAVIAAVRDVAAECA
jgi:dTDP-4-amino-4,6-dideoxygalactose transaminase